MRDVKRIKIMLTNLLNRFADKHKLETKIDEIGKEIDLNHDVVIKELEKIIKPAVEKPKSFIFEFSKEVKVESIEAYRKLADSVGFRPARLILNELYAFLEEESIEIFNGTKVYNYLSSIKPEDCTHWCWRPLREKDATTAYIWGRDANFNYEDGFYDATHASWQCRPYNSLIPYHALEKVAKIENKFGNYVKFFVSDFANPDVDPFIMCQATPPQDGGRSMIIFDCWDEPGFKR
jgi:hypothetical protein